METRKSVKPYPAELRERAVRMVQEHGREHASEWAAMRSIAAKVGCTAETLRQWVRQAERDRGERGGLTSDERARPPSADFSPIALGHVSAAILSSHRMSDLRPATKGEVRPISDVRKVRLLPITWRRARPPLHDANPRVIY